MKFKTWKIKAISFIVFCFAICSFTKGQNHQMEGFNERWNSIELNNAYLRQVKDENLLGPLTNLQVQAACYDIRQSEVFDGIESYRVTFSLADNKVVAVYGPKGEIERSHECYKNIRIPSSIMDEIVSKYGNWKILENKYLIYYNKTGKLERSLKVKLGKQQNQMWVKYDS